MAPQIGIICPPWPCFDSFDFSGDVLGQNWVLSRGRIRIHYLRSFLAWFARFYRQNEPAQRWTTVESVDSAHDLSGDSFAEYFLSMSVGAAPPFFQTLFFPFAWKCWLKPTRNKTTGFLEAEGVPNRTGVANLNKINKLAWRRALHPKSRTRSCQTSLFNACEVGEVKKSDSQLPDPLGSEKIVLDKTIFSKAESLRKKAIKRIAQKSNRELRNNRAA